MALAAYAAARGSISHQNPKYNSYANHRRYMILRLSAAGLSDDEIQVWIDRLRQSVDYLRRHPNEQPP